MRETVHQFRKSFAQHLHHFEGKNVRAPKQVANLLSGALTFVLPLLEVAREECATKDEHLGLASATNMLDKCLDELYEIVGEANLRQWMMNNLLLKEARINVLLRSYADFHGAHRRRYPQEEIRYLFGLRDTLTYSTSLYNERTKANEYFDVQVDPMVFPSPDSYFEQHPFSRPISTLLNPESVSYTHSQWNGVWESVKVEFGDYILEIQLEEQRMANVNVERWWKGSDRIEAHTRKLVGIHFEPENMAWYPDEPVAGCIIHYKNGEPRRFYVKGKLLVYNDWRDAMPKGIPAKQLKKLRIEDFLEQCRNHSPNAPSSEWATNLWAELHQATPPSTLQRTPRPA
jgi:hypothetical protein